MAASRPIFTAMHGFTKLFGTIVTSTIWREDDRTRILWITLLALSDRLGNVSASIPGLAALANMDVASCEAALDKLKSPDPYSRTKDFGGSRIKDIDGGWHILNYVKYRELGNRIERTEYLRGKQREHRSCQQMSTGVNSVSTVASASASESASGKGEAGETIPDPSFDIPAPLQTPEFVAKRQMRLFSEPLPTLEQVKLQCAKIGLPESEGEAFFNYYESNGWKVGKNPMKKWSGALANWNKNFRERHTPAVSREMQISRPSNPDALKLKVLNPSDENSPANP